MSRVKTSQVVQNFMHNVKGTDQSVSAQRIFDFLFYKGPNRSNRYQKDLIARRVLDSVIFKDDESVPKSIRKILIKENAIALSERHFREMTDLFREVQKNIGKLIDDPANFMENLDDYGIAKLNHCGDKLREGGIAWPRVENARDVFCLYVRWLEKSQYSYMVFYGNNGRWEAMKKLQELDIEKYKIRLPWIFMVDDRDVVLFTLSSNIPYTYSTIDED